MVIRVGTGANSTTGGTMQNSPTGADSIIRYRVTVIDDCLLITCDSVLDDQAYILEDNFWKFI